MRSLEPLDPMNHSPTRSEVNPPSNPPRPRFVWVFGGLALIILGVLCIPTVVLTAIGFFLIVTGIGIMVAAFIVRDGAGVRTESDINPAHPGSRPYRHKHRHHFHRHKKH